MIEYKRGRKNYTPIEEIIKNKKKNFKLTLIKGGK